MLFNPNWQRPAPTLDGLIAWLEKQPGDNTYQYTDSRNCLLCQYITSLGYSDVRVVYNTFREGPKGGWIDFPDELRQVTIKGLTDLRGGTKFSTALAHAREMANTMRKVALARRQRKG